MMRIWWRMIGLDVPAKVLLACTAEDIRTASAWLRRCTPTLWLSTAKKNRNLRWKIHRMEGNVSNDGPDCPSTEWLHKSPSLVHRVCRAVWRQKKHRITLDWWKMKTYNMKRCHCLAQPLTAVWKSSLKIATESRSALAATKRVSTLEKFSKKFPV